MFRVLLAASLILFPAMWAIAYVSPAAGILLCVFGCSALLLVASLRPPEKKPFKPRYPKELREAVTKILPVIKTAKTKNDPELLAAVDNLKDSHPLFSDVAFGLVRLRFRNDRS